MLYEVITVLTIIADADITALGGFSQNGTGAVSTAGDITTTSDAIDFLRAVTLTDGHAVAFDSAGGLIQFQNTLNGSTDFADDLQLAAVGGSIDFQDAVGAATDLGNVTVVSALNVTTDVNGFNSDTLQQQAGSGTTTFNGVITSYSIHYTKLYDDYSS